MTALKEIENPQKSTDSYSTGTLNESAKNGKGGEKSNPS